MSDVTVSKVQKHSSNTAIDDAEQTSLFSEIETAGKDSDNDIDMVLDKLGIPESDRENLKKALTADGKTSYADILDFLDSDDDGTVETSEITESIKSDTTHGKHIGQTRNGTNGFDTTGEDTTTSTPTSTSKSKSTTAKTSRDTDQNDADYVDKMFNSTSGKEKNSFFKQDLESFLKPTNGSEPDAEKLAMILQKMGFAKKDPTDDKKSIPNEDLAQDIIEYYKSDDNFSTDDFADMLRLIMGDKQEYNSSDKNDNKVDIATRAESETAIEKFIKAEESINGINPTVQTSIVRVDVDGKTTNSIKPATSRNPDETTDDAKYLNRIFKSNEGKPANSFLQDDIKAFMYNSDSSVIDEAKLATLLKTMAITQTGADSPTELAKSMIAYIKNIQSAGTAQEKLIDLLSGRNSDFKSNIGNKDDTIIESSETLSVLTTFINSDKAGAAKGVTTLPDAGSILADLPTAEPSDRGNEAGWFKYLQGKGVVTDDANYTALLNDVAKANGKGTDYSPTADEMKAFLDNDKSGDGVTIAEARLSRFSNSNNGFAINPDGLRAYLATSGDNPFIKGQLLNEYLLTIGINAGDAGTLKDMLMDNTNEEIVAFLTAGQADGGKLITPSQIQKNIMTGGNLPQNEKDIIAGFSGGGVYNAGTGATTDTQFSGLSDDEIINNLKTGLIDITTYLNMDNPNTSEIENDFNKLPQDIKKKRLDNIQKSRGKTLDDLYPQELIGRKLKKGKDNEYEETKDPNQAARLQALTLDQALMLTGTGGKNIAEAHLKDTSLYKMTFTKNDINAEHYNNSTEKIEMYSSDAFRLVSMQYTTDELKNGKLKEILTPLFREVGRAATEIDTITEEYKKDLGNTPNAEQQAKAFNTMIGKVFAKHKDADNDRRDNNLFTHDDMQ